MMRIHSNIPGLHLLLPVFSSSLYELMSAVFWISHSIHTSIQFPCVSVCDQGFSTSVSVPVSSEWSVISLSSLPCNIKHSYFLQQFISCLQKKKNQEWYIQSAHLILEQNSYLLRWLAACAQPPSARCVPPLHKLRHTAPCSMQLCTVSDRLVKFSSSGRMFGCWTGHSVTGFKNIVPIRLVFLHFSHIFHTFYSCTHYIHSMVWVSVIPQTCNVKKTSHRIFNILYMHVLCAAWHTCAVKSSCTCVFSKASAQL